MVGEGVGGVVGVVDVVVDEGGGGEEGEGLGWGGEGEWGMGGGECGEKRLG